MWREQTLGLKLEILSIKCLKKLSHASEATGTVLTEGLTAELITENRTLGVECFFLLIQKNK